MATPPARACECARCGRQATPSVRWPDGPICRTCYRHAVRTYGRCQGCRADRLLPGRDGAGQPICRDCAGVTQMFSCSRCGVEGDLWSSRLCERCTLANRVDYLLSNSEGRVDPALMPVAEALRDTDRPRSRLIWLRNPDATELLQALAAGRTPLTHDGLQEASGWRTATLLRDLLMAHGVLPPVDRQIFLYQRWLNTQLDAVEDAADRRLLQHFARWRLLRQLRSEAERKPLGPSQAGYARRQFNEARQFLAWLARRNRATEQCRQEDLDAWKVHSGQAASPFLRWCADQGHLPKLKHSPHTAGFSAAAPEHARRSDDLRRVFLDDGLPLRIRVAAALVLLYAQPVTRLVRLTTTHVSDDGTTVTIAFGDPPSPLPELIADLIRQYLDSDARLRHASPQSASWLFPGRQAGQPMTPARLREQLREAGISPGSSRVAALRHYLQHTPPPVVAKALGYHDFTTAYVATEVGAPWSRYAPGDHSR